MKSYEVLGVRVDAATIDSLQTTVRTAIAEKRQVVIANHNLHSVRLYHRDPRFREFYASADVVHVDGMPIIFAARLKGLPLSRKNRITYVDWMPAIWESSATEGWRIFYLGSRPGVAAAGARILRARYGGLQLETHHGYFEATVGSAENRDVIREIRNFGTHVLMVGMGMPRQELWVAENRRDLACNAVLVAGAAMDYVAGCVKTPPRWMGRIGLEWFYRMCFEPVRLGRRYLVEPWGLLGPLWRDITRRREKPEAADRN